MTPQHMCNDQPTTHKALEVSPHTKNINVKNQYSDPRLQFTS